MKKFNEINFLNTVYRMNKISPALVSEPCAKNLLSLAGFQCGYSQSDVLTYIQKVGDSLIEGFTDSTFDAKGWHFLYSYVVKEGICSELKLADFGNYKKKTADELESNFNNVISKWYNPSLLKAIFKVDSLHAWTWMLHTILSMAEGKTPEYITVAELLSRYQAQKENNQVRSTGVRTNSLRKKGASRRPKGKSRSPRPVDQYALNGTLVARHNSLQEAVGKNESYKKATIQYCLNGHSQTAYGYKWQWGDESIKTETSAFSQLNEHQATTSPDYCQDLIHPNTEITGNFAIGNTKDGTLNNSKENAVLIAYFLNDKKKIDFSRKIGRYKSQTEACQELGLNKSTLCNYLKGRKDSIWYHNNGNKVRIGFQIHLEK